VNDELENEELIRQIELMDKEGLGGFFFHSREGLIIPYLSEEWFKKFSVCVSECKKRGMYCWIYDEDRWPSGFAGGLVNSKGHEYWRKFIVMEEVKDEDKIEEDKLIGVYQIEFCNDKILKIEDVTENKERWVKEYGKKLFKAKYEIETRYLIHEPEWFNGYPYVDLLNEKVTMAFIESTHEEYKKRFSNEFGKVILGVFTDEPNYHETPWTKSLENRFKKEKGYSFREKVPLLFYDSCNIKEAYKFRYDYYDIVTKLFVENYTKKIYEWCERNGLKLTGHFLFEDTLQSQVMSVGDLMRHYEYQHIPGIDHLTRQIDTVITVKQVSSVASQLGKERVLCETYGGSGMNLSFKEQKWLADWLYCLGVNLMTQHFWTYSLRGNRKRDWPPSFSYQQPWADDYNILSDYIARLSFILSKGKRIVQILIIHPIESAFVAYRPVDKSTVEWLNNEFYKLSNMLLKLHYDYEYGNEYLIEKYGRTEKGRFIIGNQSYDIVVIPPSITLRTKTLSLLKDFVLNGGKVIAIKPLPYLLDGSKEFNLMDELKGVMIVDNEYSDIAEALKEVVCPAITVEGDAANVLYHLREINEGDKRILVCFLCNTDLYNSYEFELKLLNAPGRLELWNLVTGEIEPLPSKTVNSYKCTKIKLEPAGSALILSRGFQDFEGHHKKEDRKEIRVVGLEGKWNLKLLCPNALTLDYCQVSINGGNWSQKMHVTEAQKFLETKCKEGDKVRVRYEFYSTLEEVNNGAIVVEGGRTFIVSLNNNELKPNGWWIDINFVKYPIKRLNRGENLIELSFKFKNPKKKGTLIYVKGGTEIDNVYVVGNFGIQCNESHFIITEEPKICFLGNLVRQGLPFFAGKVILSKKINLEKIKESKVIFSLYGVNAALVKIRVNKSEDLILPWPPYETDISRYVVDGENEVEVELTSSLRNLLGPHHLNIPFSLKDPFLSEIIEPNWVSPYILKKEANPLWSDDYKFTEFGIKGAELLIYQNSRDPPSKDYEEN